MDKAFKHLAPGGWFEAQELSGAAFWDDDSVSPSNAFARYSDDITRASEYVNRSVLWPPQLKEWLVEAGFVDVEEKVFKIPINGWARDRRLKEIGMLWQHNWVTGLSGFSYALLNQAQGRTIEDIEVSLLARSPPYEHNSTPAQDANMKLVLIRSPWWTCGGTCVIGIVTTTTRCGSSGDGSLNRAHRDGLG